MLPNLSHSAPKLNNLPNVMCLNVTQEVGVDTGKSEIVLPKEDGLSLFLQTAFFASLIRGRLNTKALTAIFEMILDTDKIDDFVRVGADYFLGQTMLDTTFVGTHLAFNI